MKGNVKDLGIAVVILLVFWWVVSIKTSDLKNEINKVVAFQCQTSSTATATLITQYNAGVQTSIDQQTTAARLNSKPGGDPAKTAADLAYAKRFKAALITLPPADCSVPLLK